MGLLMHRQRQEQEYTLARAMQLEKTLTRIKGLLLIYSKEHDNSTGPNEQCSYITVTYGGRGSPLARIYKFMLGMNA